MFVASNPSTDNVRDILDGVVRVTGLEGWDARKPRDGESLSRIEAYKSRHLQLTTDGERAWVTPVLQKPSLGHAVTGWAPRRIGVSDGIEMYWVRLRRLR